MVDLYRIVKALLLALILGTIWTNAHASFPATQTNTSACTVAPCVESRYVVWGYPGGFFISLDAACSSSAAAVNASSYYLTAGNPRVSSSRCYVDGVNRSDGIPQGTFSFAVNMTQTVPPAAPIYGCPANSTVSGSICTCDAPAWVQDGNACISQQASMNQDCNAISSGLNRLGAPLVHFGSVGLTACFGGYVMAGTGAASGGGQTELYGPFTCSGADASACSVVPKPTEITANCEPGSYPGTVNGVQVCVPPTNSVEAPKTITNEPASPGGTAADLPGAPSGSTTQEKQTQCEGSSCKTTTVYKDPSGTTTGSTTEITSKASYCAENPKAPGCSSLEASTFSGGCSGGFTFTGDAIQGALAREVHRQNCIINDGSSESALYDAKNALPDGDLTVGLSGNETVNVGPSGFDSSDAIGGAACIANKTVEVWGKTVVLPFSDVCPALGYLKAILLAISWLVAAGIVIGRKT